MRKILLTFCLGALLNLHALTWNTPVAIPPGVSNGVNANIGLVFDAEHDQLIAAWGDSNTRLPYYSIYNGSSWSPAATFPLGGSSGVWANMSLVWDDSSHQTVMTWADATSQALYYTVYNGSAWSTPAAIPLGASSGATDAPTLVFDSGNNQVIAVWADFNSNVIYYALYNGVSWSTPATIPLGASQGSSTQVFLSYDSSSNQVVAFWGDSATQAPYYSVYDGTSWSVADTVPLGLSTGVSEGAIAVDANPDETIAVWIDISKRVPAVFYSAYSAGTWSTGESLFTLGAGAQPSTPELAYDAAADQMVALWQDQSSNSLNYSTFDGTSWSAVASVPLGSQSTGAKADSLIYNPVSQQIFAFWSDYNTFLPYVATTQAGPNPPGSATAQLLFDHYMNATDRVHLLQWTASSDATTVGYQISSGAGVEGSTTATQIYLRNRVKGQSYTYSIAAYNESGETGTPLVVSAEG